MVMKLNLLSVLEGVLPIAISMGWHGGLLSLCYIWKWIPPEERTPVAGAHYIGWAALAGANYHVAGSMFLELFSSRP